MIVLNLMVCRTGTILLLKDIHRTHIYLVELPSTMWSLRLLSIATVAHLLIWSNLIRVKTDLFELYALAFEVR